MQAMQRSHVATHAASALALAALLALGAAPTGAQEPDFSHPTDEPSSGDTLMERSDLGNVVAAARMKLAEGNREMKRAVKLEKKRDAADPAKRGRFEAQVVAAYERAAQSFQSAIRTSPNMLEAYAGLGSALAHLGRHKDSLEVHAAALRKDAADDDNFRGWAAAMLEMDMLGDATQAYDHFAGSNPAQAEILLELMHDWLERRRLDPGDLAPADVERLASWLAERG